MGMTTFFSPTFSTAPTSFRHSSREGKNLSSSNVFVGRKQQVYGTGYATTCLTASHCHHDLCSRGARFRIREAAPRRHAALVQRPFGARCLGAKPDIDGSDSSSRVRSARSVPCESTMLVYAAMADARSRHYSRWERKGSGGGRCPAGRSRPLDEGSVAAAGHSRMGFGLSRLRPA